MSAERNKQVVRRIFEDYVNRGNPELLDELFVENYVGAQSGAPAMGRDGFAATLGALREGFPDIRYSIADLIAEVIGSPPAGSGRARTAECFEDRPEPFRPPASRSRTTESGSLS